MRLNVPLEALAEQVAPDGLGNSGCEAEIQRPRPGSLRFRSTITSPAGRDHEPDQLVDRAHLAA